MSEIKNKQASILARLRNIARENAIEFNSILILCMQERFLYRLSISAHAHTDYVFCKWEFPSFAKYFPQAPVGNLLCKLALYHLPFQPQKANSDYHK